MAIRRGQAPLLATGHRGELVLRSLRNGPDPIVRERAEELLRQGPVDQ